MTGTPFDNAHASRAALIFYDLYNVRVGQEQIFSDLAESRQQIAAGQGLNMEDALNGMGKKHGFI